MINNAMEQKHSHENQREKEIQYITYQLICFITVMVVDLIILLYLSTILPLGSPQRDTAAFSVASTIPLDFLLLFLRFDP
jgi:biotin transporter BioY